MDRLRKLSRREDFMRTLWFWVGIATMFVARWLWDGGHIG